MIPFPHPDTFMINWEGAVIDKERISGLVIDLYDESPVVAFNEVDHTIILADYILRIEGIAEFNKDNTNEVKSFEVVKASLVRKKDARVL